MSKIGLAVGIVVGLAGAAVAGYFVVQSKKPDLSPAGPNRELAPGSLAFYAELPGLSTTWSKVEGTEAWQDLAMSGLAKRALDSKAAKDLMAAIDQVAAKAEYRLTQRNAMKFVGRECSVGFSLDPAGGAPHLLVLTKLDVDALVKDLLIGKTDIDSLWDELQRRTGKLDFAVTTSVFKEHKIATAARDGAEYHAALLGDTLAVSTNAALLHEAIECRISGGAKSLGKRAEFQADVAASAPGAAILEWYDLDAMDKGRASLDAGLASLGVEPVGAAAVHGLLDGTRGAHSFARSTSLPDGDLYRATWTYSKSTELFADKASPVLRDLAKGEWMAYGEMRDVGGVVKAWNGSALKRRLGDGEIGRWLDELMDDPRKKMEEVANSLPMGGSMQVTGDADELLDRFTMRMGKHLASEQIGNLMNGEGCFAIDMDAEHMDKPKIVVAVRLGTEGRLAAHAIVGALLESKPGGLTAQDAGTRKVLSVSKGIEVHFALVGDTLLVGTDVDAVRAVARTGQAEAGGPGKHVAGALSALKPGWRTFVYADFVRVRSMLGAMNDRSMGPVDQIFELYRKIGLIGDRIAYAGYVADDFSSVELRTLMWNDGVPAGKETPAPRDPLAWRSLPKSTFMHAVNTESGIPTMWASVKGAMELFAGGTKEMEAAFRDSMEMDLEEDLIPALGRELSFAMTYIAAGPDDGPDAPIVLPGLILGLEVKDAKVVKKALDRALELAETGIRESGTSADKVFVREPYGGVEIVRADIPESERPPVRLSPALVLQDGYLTVSTDLATLRACIDAKNAKAPSVADSKMFKDATASLGPKPPTFVLLDWPAMLDQLSVYAPRFGSMVGREDVPFPEMPQDGTPEEQERIWKERLADYQAKVAASAQQTAKKGGEKAMKWMDALRVIDFIAADSREKDGVTEMTYVMRFTK